MKCLIDGDVLKYELGFAAETAWKGRDEDGVPPWPVVEDMIERRIDLIEFECRATQPSKLFFTGQNNFRIKIAKRKPYKERPANKPYHFRNIELYLKSNYEYREDDELEADDLMSIEQISSDFGTTIICTRDKDLRQVSGWQYGWEVGKQPGFGPHLVRGYGDIVLRYDGKISGTGLKFFLSQCLTGDAVDNVPGLPGCGPVAALKKLEDTKTYLEGLAVVMAAYRDKYGEGFIMELTEQAQLLWMVRELDAEGAPVMWHYWEDYEQRRF